jgi:Zn-dependent protease with chaperone function
MHDVAEWLKEALLHGGGWPLGLVLIANSFVLSMACQKLGAAICLRPVRKLQTENWAEKARVSYPVWVGLGSGLFVLGVLSLVQALAFDKHISFPGAGWVPSICMASSFLAGALVNNRVETRLKGRKVTIGDWLRHLVIPLLLFGPHYLVLLWLALSTPDRFTPLVWIYVGVGGVAILFYVFSGGLFIARLLGMAWRAPASVERIVEAAAQRVGIWPKASYLIRWKAVNALAFPVIGRIAISDTAAKHLAEDELIAICVHELGHLNESRRIKTLRIVASFLWLPVICTKPLLGTYGLPGIAVLALGILFGHRAVRRLSRAMEERADAIGHAHEGESGTYARALEHIYQLNLIPAVMPQKRAMHPHLYDRLLAAGIVPAYPRPNPPSRWRASIAVLAMLGCAVVYLVISSVILAMIVDWKLSAWVE